MIFCKGSKLKRWQKLERLNRLENRREDVFYPFGTWCHRDRETGVDHYCQENHQCRPIITVQEALII